MQLKRYVRGGGRKASNTKITNFLRLPQLKSFASLGESGSHPAEGMKETAENGMFYDIVGSKRLLYLL